MSRWCRCIVINRLCKLSENYYAATMISRYPILLDIIIDSSKLLLSIMISSVSRKVLIMTSFSLRSMSMRSFSCRLSHKMAKYQSANHSLRIIFNPLFMHQTITGTLFDRYLSLLDRYHGFLVLHSLFSQMFLPAPSLHFI